MSPELYKFVSSHQEEDTTRLLLSFSKRQPCGVDVALAAACVESRRKLRRKAPRWAQDDVLCPVALSAEQCSSAAAAAYKARLAARLCCGIAPRIADLTSGLGVDCAAFSAVASAVLYNDMNPLLAEFAPANFAALGCANVKVSCREINVSSAEEIIADFRPDMVFLDPARRASGTGSKVWKLEDCSPNVLELLPVLLGEGRTVMIKLSPMADITLLRRVFDGCLRELHVVCSEGECKELLAVLQAGCSGSARFVLADAFSDSECSILEYDSDCPADRRRFLSSAPASGDTVFEPGSGLMKAGCWPWLCEAFGLSAAGASAHVFFGARRSELDAFGRWYRVAAAVPFSKAAVKDFGRRYPRAEVVAHNAHMTSDELRRRLGVNEGAGVRLMALGASSSVTWLLALEKIS